ncbi:MAG: Fur family transcriptional regulator [Candidatus Jordarchaeaceae archaeon]
MEQKIREFIEILRRKGYKVTPQRVELFKIIKTSKHPTAEEVYQKVKADYPTVSPATVYKTIELLRSMGEVQEIGVINGKVRYETNTNPHINIHCLICGDIEDIFSEKIKESINDIASRSDYKIISQNYNFYGYCPKCQKKLSEKSQE